MNLMELINGESVSELLEAQSHVLNHTFNFISSMSLKCAVELGVPDIIHSHDQPMTLSALVSALPIHSSKADYVYRLMRMLVHAGYFTVQKVGDNLDQEGYSLTPASRLLLKDNPSSIRPFILMVLDPIVTKPWDCLSTWFQNADPTSFHVAYGTAFWDYAGQDPRLNNLFNAAMASDCFLVSDVVLSKCKGVFEGLESLVDVAGGTGTFAKAIARAFPHLKCTVLDLQHVVANLQGSENLNFLGGDMFVQVPPADAILLKWILHDWGDKECVKILERCKEAIMRKEKGGKVIIIDIVLENQDCNKKSSETQLYFDLQMMVHHSGQERNEKEWAKIFFDAGFKNYTINPVLGIRSLIEVYP